MTCHTGARAQSNSGCCGYVRSAVDLPKHVFAYVEDESWHLDFFS